MIAGCTALVVTPNMKAYMCGHRVCQDLVKASKVNWNMLRQLEDIGMCFIYFCLVFFLLLFKKYMLATLPIFGISNNQHSKKNRLLQVYLQQNAVQQLVGGLVAIFGIFPY